MSTPDRDPMSDEAAERALLYLLDSAADAGKAKADATYMENYRKIVLARLRRDSGEKTDAARDAWARQHPDYLQVCEAQREAITRHETMYWKRIAAQATIDAWRTKNANYRDAGSMR